ncbi:MULTISPECIES: ATP-dependent DNA ligase [unclassified Streptomyces]|uniref:ATP-dependent DNA ligase n=1 Tax=unclassified Streptomyces TaxID=2593676 RepID=UPI003702C75A
MVLQPPVEPMLAQARDSVPAPGALPGRLIFQPKFDGYRALLFTGPVRLQSRRGSLIQARFPELVAAAANLPDDLVLDGELIVWTGEGMSFEALQRRAAVGHLSAPLLAEELPAHLIVFDVLQVDGQELLHAPYAERRARLEQLFTGHDLVAPWALCPETDDPATAQEWLASWTRVPGVEGLIIRGTEQHYLRGARALYKVRRRDTTEAIIGAITGPLEHPQTLILGRYDDTGHLRPVGRSTPLRNDAARQLAERLTPAGPRHPWQGVRFTSSWGSSRTLDVTLVEPGLVAEIAVDTAQERGGWRHPIRYARLRLDLSAADVPAFGEGA